MRYSFVLAIILTFLVPAANAISLSVNGGNGNAAVGATMTYESTLKDKVQQDIKLQPASSSIENYWTFSGAGTTSRYASGAWAGYAQSGFSISGSNAQTTYDYASSAFPYAVTAETLTSTGATDINCYGLAYSSSGDFAYVNTEVNDPSGSASLVGYSNTAVGALYFAAASQSISGYAYAPTGYTWNEEYAAQRNGDVSYLYDSQGYSGVQYVLPYTTDHPSVAVANDDYSYAANSVIAYGGSWHNAYAYAKPYGYDAVTDSKSSSPGWKVLFQEARTYQGNPLYTFASNVYYG